MKYILIPEAASTNSWCAANIDSLDLPVIVRAEAQTAGRGQRGNSWESAPGRNLTMSAVVKPHGLVPIEQFSLSEAVALAVADTLIVYGIPAKVKWPNDIYVGDRKICGILIENAVAGREILHSICGVGLNVNQEEFISDAPNPISMRQLTGIEYDLTEVEREFGRQLEQRCGLLASPGGRDMLHADFMRSLWRGDGKAWPFRDTASGMRFEAVIADVDPKGPLRLLRSDFTPLTYNFKEVEFLL